MLSSLVLTLAVVTGAQHWTAYSTTAMSITGDVTFTPQKMTFSNGTSVALVRARAMSSTSTLYALSGKNPALLRGNTLCSTKLPGYVLIERKGTMVYLTFYSAGKGVPLGANAARTLCATYNYGAK